MYNRNVPGKSKRSSPVLVDPQVSFVLQKTQEIRDLKESSYWIPGIDRLKKKLWEKCKNRDYFLRTCIPLLLAKDHPSLLREIQGLLLVLRLIFDSWRIINTQLSDKQNVIVLQNPNLSVVIKSIFIRHCQFRLHVSAHNNLSSVWEWIPNKARAFTNGFSLLFLDYFLQFSGLLGSHKPAAD